MRKNRTILLISLLIFVSSIFIQRCQNQTNKTGGTVEVKNTTYKGWDEAIKIDNNKIKVIVVPAIGRIMSFGYSDGQNLLWNNEKYLGQRMPYLDNEIEASDWINYGGDKVWPLEEDAFPRALSRSWPPDEYFDNSAFEYKLLENGVIIKSPVSKNTGTALTRKITMAENSTQLNIAQEVTQVKTEPKYPVTIWKIGRAHV